MHGRDHRPTGADPIPGLLDAAPGGDTVDAVIAALDPAGFWKLDESSGSVAADSSGNSLDMTVPTGRADPDWGQPAGPPGDQAANLQTGASSGAYCRVDRAWASLTGPFTAGLFVSVNDDTWDFTFMGQGNTGHGTSSVGWELRYFNNDVWLNCANGAGIQSDNPLPQDTWALVTAVKDGATAGSSTWRLYLNGVEQGTAYTGSYTSYGGGGLWIGSNDGVAGFSDIGSYFTGSYAFLIPEALTDLEILHIWETAAPVDANQGKVPVATGLGSSNWDWPLEVTY